jgi:hypothetical protein
MESIIWAMNLTELLQCIFTLFVNPIELPAEIVFFLDRRHRVSGFKLIKPHTKVAYNLVLQEHPLPLRERAGAKHSFTNRLTA